jgi:hypothetical protein
MPIRAHDPYPFTTPGSVALKVGLKRGSEHVMTKGGPDFWVGFQDLEFV